MIDKEKIGHAFNITVENGCKLNIIIEDDASKFPFYREMGLDVFKGKATPIAKKPTHNYSKLKNLLAADLKEYAKTHGIKGNTKKDILNAIREGNK